MESPKEVVKGPAKEKQKTARHDKHREDTTAHKHTVSQADIAPESSSTMAEQPLPPEDTQVFNSLNARFRGYLNSVRSLNDINNQLSAKLSGMQSLLVTNARTASGSFGVQLKAVQQALVNERVDLVKAITKVAVAGEAGKHAKMKLKQLQAEMRLMNDRHVLLKKQKAEAVQQVSYLTAKVKNLTDQNENDRAIICQLEEEEEELQSKLSQSRVESARVHVEVEITRDRIAFENALSEELQESCRTKLQADSGEDELFYKNELERSKVELREQFEQRHMKLVQQIKESTQQQLDKLRQTLEDKRKYEEHEPTTSQSDKIPTDMAKEMDELHTLKQKNDVLQRELYDIEAKYEEFRALTNDCERRQRDDIDSIRLRIIDLLADIRTSRTDEESLKTELETYRKLLDQEETRISRFEVNQQQATAGAKSADQKHTGSEMFKATFQESIREKSQMAANRSHVIIRSTEQSQRATSHSVVINEKQETVSTKKAHTTQQTQKSDKKLMVQVNCRCGFTDTVEERKLESDEKGIFIKCVDCCLWSHAGCYQIADIKDRKRRNFYCEKCYKTMLKKRRT